ncbi:Very-long-chain (3R)-3-hydroxyacyl-CoA dehydratase [Cercospora zeina]
MAPPASSRSNPTGRTQYLTAYNTVFSLLWLYVLVSALQALPGGRLHVFSVVERDARWIQTLSLLDVVHSATGLIPAPLGSTFTQIATRVIQVWLIWAGFSSTTATSIAFPALLIAWSIADTIRYAYLALNLHGKAPDSLIWVRYSMFYVLYPVGIACEWWLMFRAVGPASEVRWVLKPVFYFLLALYVPGSYMMFTYMIKQRRKTLSKKAKN